MGAAQTTAHEASLLMGATMAVTMAGIFTGIFFLFIDVDIPVRLSAAILVGLVGIISIFGTRFITNPIRRVWGGDRSIKGSSSRWVCQSCDWNLGTGSGSL